MIVQKIQLLLKFLFNRCYVFYLVIGFLLMHGVNHQKVIFKTLDAFRRAEQDVILQAQGKDVMKDFVLYDAIRYYKNIIALIPDSSIAHSLLGFCYYQAKEYDLAIESYKKAIALEDAYLGLHYNLGVIYFDIKDYPKAIQSFQKALETNPQKTLSFAGLVTPFKESKVNGIESYREQRIKILKETYVKSYEYMIVSDYCLKDYSALLKDSLKGLSLNLNSQDFFYYYVITAAYQLKKYKAVIKYCSQAIQNKADSSEIYRYLGRAFKEIGLEGLAQNAFSQAAIWEANNPQGVNFQKIEPHQPLFLYVVNAKKEFMKAEKKKEIRGDD